MPPVRRPWQVSEIGELRGPPLHFTCIMFEGQYRRNVNSYVNSEYTSGFYVRFYVFSKKKV